MTQQAYVSEKPVHPCFPCAVSFLFSFFASAASASASASAFHYLLSAFTSAAYIA
jgi:hypothetical protein